MANNTKHTGSALIVDHKGQQQGAVNIANGQVTVSTGNSQENKLGKPKEPVKQGNGPQTPEGGK